MILEMLRTNSIHKLFFLKILYIDWELAGEEIKTGVGYLMILYESFYEKKSRSYLTI